MSQVGARDLSLLALLGLVWGLSFPFISAGLATFDPFLFAAVRYDIAALVMLGVAIATRHAHHVVPTNATQWKAVLVSGALNVMAYHALLYWGQQFTTAGIAAVIVALNPILAMVVSRALLPGERVGALGVVGLLLGIGGIVALVGLKPGDLLDVRGMGELAVVGCVVAWALGAVLVKRSNHGIPVLPFTVAQMMTGAIMLHILSLIFEGTAPRATLTWVSFGALLYMAVIASGFGFLLYFSLLERIGPIRASLVSYLAPIVATTAGLLILDDPFEWRAGIAFTVIFAGFLLVVVRPRRSKQPEAARAPPARAP